MTLKSSQFFFKMFFCLLMWNMKLQILYLQFYNCLTFSFTRSNMSSRTNESGAVNTLACRGLRNQTTVWTEFQSVWKSLVTFFLIFIEYQQCSTKIYM